MSSIESVVDSSSTSRRSPTKTLSDLRTKLQKGIDRIKTSPELDCLDVTKRRNILFYNITIGFLLALSVLTISTALANSYYVKKENDKDGDCPDVNDWLSWVMLSIGAIATIVTVTLMFIVCRHYLNICCGESAQQ